MKSKFQETRVPRGNRGKERKLRFPRGSVERMFLWLFWDFLRWFLINCGISRKISEGSSGEWIGEWGLKWDPFEENELRNKGNKGREQRAWSHGHWGRTNWCVTQLGIEEIIGWTRFGGEYEGKDYLKKWGIICVWIVFNQGEICWWLSLWSTTNSFEKWKTELVMFLIRISNRKK